MSSRAMAIPIIDKFACRVKFNGSEPLHSHLTDWADVNRNLLSEHVTSYNQKDI